MNVLRALAGSVAVGLLLAACGSTVTTTQTTLTRTVTAAPRVATVTQTVTAAAPTVDQTPTTSAPIPDTSPTALTTSADDGPSLTGEQENAVASAQQYLDGGTGFSRNGLIDQLSSQYGEGYPKNVATIAVDSLHEDWNAQAVLAANNYLETQPFSCSGLIGQLESEYGSQFTHSQAVYGAKASKACS